jgi:MoxR-like ATPase
MKSKFFLGVIFLSFINLQAQAITCQTAVLPEAQVSKKLSGNFRILLDQISEQRVINQRPLLERTLITILLGKHIMIEGVTGVGKTQTALSFAEAISGQLSREQFTADTTPTDLMGSNILNQETRKYDYHPGSLLRGNIFLADEINRATPRTQSALLEGMEEGHVTVNGQTHKLPDVFTVIATQNPGHQIGTYALPEATKDRFLFWTVVGHSNMETEAQILKSYIQKQQDQVNGVQSSLKNPLSLNEAKKARKFIYDINVPEEVRQFILKIIDATRNPAAYSKSLTKSIREGIGFRGTASLELGARGLAWLHGNDHVEISDVKEIAYDVLRHRLILTDDALAEGKTSDDVIREILNSVEKK